MTVISPYQRQLVFTDSGVVLSRTRKTRTNFLKKAVGLMSLTRTFAILVALVAFFGFGFFFMAVDSVLLSFKIQSLSREIESRKISKEKLELKQAALLSPDSLKDYALMVKLENPVSINYQVRN